MDSIGDLLAYVILILDLLQGLEWLHKKVKALYHAYNTKKNAQIKGL